MNKKSDSLRLLFKTEHEIEDALNNIRVNIDYDIEHEDDLTKIALRVANRIDDLSEILNGLSQELRLTQI